jgi:hypothetical protein
MHRLGLEFLFRILPFAIGTALYGKIIRFKLTQTNTFVLPQARTLSFFTWQ